MVDLAAEVAVMMVAVPEVRVVAAALVLVQALTETRLTLQVIEMAAA